MEITRFYVQSVPATRFIGKKYGDSDRVGGSFGAKWGEAFSTGLFGTIETAIKTSIEKNGIQTSEKGEFFEDSGAFIGLMRGCEGEPFEYWIGMYTPAGTDVPDGFGYVDFPACELGVCWLHGKEETLYGKEDVVMRRIEDEGHHVKLGTDGKSGEVWCFERYACPRFTTPDENDEVILDVGFIIEG